MVLSDCRLVHQAGHTGANVPVYAWGVNAAMVDGVMDNTDLFAIAVYESVYSGDFDEDGDTDGYDLYKLVIGEQDLGQLNEFTLVFGSSRLVPSLFRGWAPVRRFCLSPIFHWIFDLGYCITLFNPG